MPAVAAKVSATATRPTTNIITTSTASFASSAGRRVGTAANVERIIPVPYSPLITSTPSTAAMSCVKVVPAVTTPTR